MLRKRLMGIVFWAFILTFLAFRVGQIPWGLFCDEALIGKLSRDLFASGTLRSPFFYLHFDYLVGSLPLYATYPFVLVLGLSEFSVRLSSVFYAFLSLYFLERIFQLLKLRFTKLSIMLIAFSPIFFHIARINFGHLPAFFCLVLGWYWYLLPTKNNLRQGLFSGMALGLALYGYSGFVLSTPLLVVVLLVKDLIHSGFKPQKLQRPLILGLTFALLLIPLIYTLLYNPDYRRRFEDKTVGRPALVSLAKGQEMLSNYPKYFGPKFLFTTATMDLGDFVTRHSLKGNGILLPVSAFFMLLGVVSLLINKKYQSYWPYVLLPLTYPLPDLISTSSTSPPYTFAIFSGMLGVYLLIAFGMNQLARLLHRLPRALSLLGKLIVVLLLLIQIVKLLGDYYRYPLYSADYWGWQYGPKPILEYFQKQSSKYDDLYLTGYFNQGQVFIEFYDPENKCPKCQIGGITQLDKTRKQLFSFRAVELNEMEKKTRAGFRLKKTIYLPNNQPEYFIGEFR